MAISKIKIGDTTHDISVDTENIIGTLPIGKGGTEATTPSGARINLGFTYGTTVPTEAPATGEGSVYFKINDDEIDLSLTIAEYQELMDLINSI